MNLYRQSVNNEGAILSNYTRPKTPVVSYETRPLGEVVIGKPKMKPKAEVRPEPVVTQRINSHKHKGKGRLRRY